MGEELSREIIIQLGVEGKHCNKCEEWRPLTDYYKKKRGLGGRNQTCKYCRREQEQKRREKDIDSKEKMRVYMREYRKVKGEELKKYHREHARKNGYSLNYKARKQTLPDTLTNEDITQTMTYFENSCFLTEDKNYHLDHVIPLKLNVLGTEKKNILPLRQDLNLSKSNKNIFEWYEEFKDFYSLSDERFIKGISYIAELNGMTYEEYKKYVFSLYA